MVLPLCLILIYELRILVCIPNLILEFFFLLLIGTKIPYYSTYTYDDTKPFIFEVEL